MIQDERPIDSSKERLDSARESLVLLQVASTQSPSLSITDSKDDEDDKQRTPFINQGSAIEIHSTLSTRLEGY